MANSQYPLDFVWHHDANLSPRKLTVSVLENAGLKRGDFLVVPAANDPAQNVKLTAAAQINDIYGVVMNQQDASIATANPTDIYVLRSFTVLMAYCQTLPEDMSGAGQQEALAQRLIDISIGFIPESNSVLGELYPDGVVWNGDLQTDATHQQPTAEVLGDIA
jgi:hypothetical protein